MLLNRRLILFLGCILPIWLSAQTGTIALEDIWLRYAYVAQSPSGFTWMNDDNYYSVLEENGVIARYSIENEKKVDDILVFAGLELGGTAPSEIRDYTFSSDEQLILLKTDIKPIYRYSSTEKCFVVSRSTRKSTPLHGGAPVSNAAFSPDGSRIAYVVDNNLFYTDLNTGKETRITSDGTFNQIINGDPDWVYEEEFALKTGFQWSPDNKRIAFYRFDESAVPEFSMEIYGSLYPEQERFKYPKAGEANATVSIHCYDLASGNTVMADLGSEKDQYVPRITWTANPSELAILRMNRLQNQLDLLIADAATGKTRVFLSESSDTYIEEPDDNTWHFLADGDLIWLSEQSGFRHIYRYGPDGKVKKALTEGEFEVTDIAGIDEAGDRVFFTSTEDSPLERHLYSVSLSGKKKKRLSEGAGTHEVALSAGYRYFTDTWSNISQVPVTRLCKSDGETMRVLADNKGLDKKLAALKLGKAEFFSFQTASKTTLNAWRILPPDFDEKKKYPVLMFVYGGPGSQTVTNEWGFGSGFNYMWYQMLAQKGYVVVSVDNRGTGARGRDFRDCTYADLGHLEAEDQIESAKYLQTLPWVDGKRIGIWGWSYGGYMTSLCLTKGKGVFKMGIAVAPVTNWRFYDTIYTERFLKTPQLNPKGYDDNSPINFAKDLQGSFLLVHGTGDDNVHFQNSMEMVTALVGANKEFDSFFYPNKNHGIYGGYTRFHLYRKMTNFVLENL